MAIVDNRSISQEGRKIGVHPIITLFLMVVLLILLAVPTYHMTNALGSFFAPNGGYMLWIVSCIAFAVSTAEPVVVQSIYHNEGISNGQKDYGGRISLIAIIVFVTAMGGWSHTVNNGKDDISSNAHGIKTKSFQSDLSAAKNDYQSKMAKAKPKDHAGITAAYRRAEAGIYRKYSKHAKTAVVKTSEAARVASTLLYCLFSLIVSILTVAYARFILRFSLSITEIPIINYMHKVGLNWTTGKAEGSNNIIDHGTGRKIPLRDELPEPEIQLKGVNLNPSNKVDTGSVQESPPASNSQRGGGFGVAGGGSGRSLNESTKQGAYLPYDQHHYFAIKKAIIDEEITPAQKPVMKKLTALNVKFKDDAARTDKAKFVLSELKSEGVIADNPKFGNSRGKVVGMYVLNKDYSESDSAQNEESEVLAKDQVKPFDIETRCNLCANYNYHHVDFINRNNGVVECTHSPCKRRYVARSHVTSDSKDIEETKKRYAESLKSNNSSIIPGAGLGLSIDENGISPTAIIGAGVIRGKS